MGGDGGTLNNSRHEHTRLRNAVLQRPDASTTAARLRQRSSTTHCALSKERLQPPYIVADRLGQLYNKEALLRHLLHRTQQQSSSDVDTNTGTNTTDDDVLNHIRSMRKDTKSVSFQMDVENNTFICPITKRTITADARFSLCWSCGSVAANVISSNFGGEIGNGINKSDGDRSPGHGPCLLCENNNAERILLGMTLEMRLNIQSNIVQTRNNKKANKSKSKVKSKSKSNIKHSNNNSTSLLKKKRTAREFNEGSPSNSNDRILKAPRVNTIATTPVTSTHATTSK